MEDGCCLDLLSITIIVKSLHILKTVMIWELMRVANNLSQFLLYACWDWQNWFAWHRRFDRFATRKLHAAYHELVKPFLALLDVRSIDRLKLQFCVKAFRKLLHVRVLRFLVYTSHFHKIRAFVVKEAHDILKNIFA